FPPQAGPRAGQAPIPANDARDGDGGVAARSVPDTDGLLRRWPHAVAPLARDDAAGFGAPPLRLGDHERTRARSARRAARARGERARAVARAPPWSERGATSELAASRGEAARVSAPVRRTLIFTFLRLARGIRVALISSP